MAILKKVSEYVYYIGNRETDTTFEEDLAKIYDYTTFIRKNISLGDFVPCNFEGNLFPQYIELGKGVLKEYKEAQERVIFKGFSIKDNGGWKTLLYEDRYYKSFANFSDAFGKETIEDFIVHNFEVTETIQKQFNL